jgi:DNA ligase-1
VPDLPLHRLVETWRRVSATRARREKTAALAALLRALAPAEVPLVVPLLCGRTRHDPLGVGPATLEAAWPASAADAPSLTVADADVAFARIAAAAGPGSGAERTRLLRDLLARATRDEQEFLAHLVLGELRQGALEAIVLDAVARAAGLPADEVRRAHMFAGDAAEVAAAALVGGAAALRGVGLRLFRPVLPMLAQPADGVEEALRRLGRAAFEYKLDGVRVQVHRAGRDVRVFTRRLNDATASVPEIVEAAASLPAREVVLDGEAIALRPDGTPHPFQVTMGRFGTRDDVAAARAALPLSVLFFDCLYLDGASLVHRTTEERVAALREVVPPALRVPRLVTDRAEEAARFYGEARAAGHEGLVAKALDAPYEAGRRGGAWLKLKPARTLDLVVLAAEWGHGRRRGRLSNLHLGARDPATGGFVMLGKTFKGLTDATLEWQTRRLLELEVARDEHTVYVRPELVVEIAFGDLQRSPRYPAGLALRFARVVRYRPDKSPEEADTLETVRRMADEPGAPRREP